MTGEELYQMYVDFQQSINNCLSDAWMELDEGDHIVWEAMAQRLQAPDCTPANCRHGY